MANSRPAFNQKTLSRAPPGLVPGGDTTGIEHAPKRRPNISSGEARSEILGDSQENDVLEDVSSKNTLFNLHNGDFNEIPA